MLFVTTYESTSNKGLLQGTLLGLLARSPRLGLAVLVFIAGLIGEIIAIGIVGTGVRVRGRILVATRRRLLVEYPKGSAVGGT